MARKTLAGRKRKKNNYPAKKKGCKYTFGMPTIFPKFTFSTEEVWGIYAFIANYIVQALQAYRDHDKAGLPYGFEEMDEWNATIQKMIDAFDILKNKNYCNDDEEQIIKEGLDLFRKYFRHLWD